MQKILIAAVMLTAPVACTKRTSSSVDADAKVAIYRLTSYQNVNGQCKIDPATAVLEPDVFINEQGIVAYDSAACIYTLTDQAMQKMKALPGGDALAITLNKEVVFFFRNMPFTTSSLCKESVVTSLGLGNGMPLRLGYPSYPEPNIPDPRNDKRLMLVLKAKGKL